MTKMLSASVLRGNNPHSTRLAEVVTGLVNIFRDATIISTLRRFPSSRLSFDVCLKESNSDERYYDSSLINQR
jgi:hypothetical protein